MRNFFDQYGIFILIAALVSVFSIAAYYRMKHSSKGPQPFEKKDE